MAPTHNAVLSTALRLPCLNKLHGKRVILASNSPRRREILKTYGLEPEVFPSKFQEDLSHSDYPNPYEYPVATASRKAIEVYERLVNEEPDDAPDLVISADTVVLSRDPVTHAAIESQGWMGKILEKPGTKQENLRMLLELNGQSCEVVTGVSLLYPIISAPGYKIKSIDERTIVHFADSSVEKIRAYVDSGEGLDRAGGFAAQGLGGLLIGKIDGDFWNVVGFPAASFFTLLDLLVEEDEDFLEV